MFASQKEGSLRLLAIGYVGELTDPDRASVRKRTRGKSGDDKIVRQVPVFVPMLLTCSIHSAYTGS